MSCLDGMAKALLVVLALTAMATGGSVAAEEIVVTVVPNLDGSEKTLVGTHKLRTQEAARSKQGAPSITVGCVPCFNVFLSFALAEGHLYAMSPATDRRRERYRVVINGRAMPVEPMNGLRGRDWVDAFAGIDHVEGCARVQMRGEGLDAMLSHGICLAK